MTCFSGTEYEIWDFALSGTIPLILNGSPLVDRNCRKAWDGGVADAMICFRLSLCIIGIL